MSTLLSVRNLVTSFRTDTGVVRAVDGVSFDVPAGSTLGIVGESGSGKSVTSLSIMRLVPASGVIESGEIFFEGQDLLKIREREMRGLRGRKISMVFQEPMTSLNPVYTVGRQIEEVIRLHQKVSRSEARKRTIEMLHTVGIAAPEERADAYPHQLSGGMRQRVLIAMALACEPALLIADEPTTALDVTIQAQILDLLRKLSDKMKMSVILITHDLGVVAEFAQEMIVMYAGQVVEKGSVRELFQYPKHPYTEGLLKCIPPLGSSRGRRSLEAPRRLPAIPGGPPDLSEPPRGCRFQARCSYADARCGESVPDLETVPRDEQDATKPSSARRSRCFFSERVGAA